MTAVLRRYTFRLYPNATQAAALDDLRWRSSRLYNALVEQRRDAWDRRRISLTRFDQGREMTMLARDPELDWRDFPSCVRERIADRVDQAFKKYFENVKAWRRGQWRKPWPPSPPRYQKGAEFTGFGYREHPKGWKWLGNRVRLQGVGTVKVRGRFPCEPVDLRTADILFRNGKWEISIVAKFSETGVMRTPTRPFSNGKASNSLFHSMGYVDIRCSPPVNGGEPQASTSSMIDRAWCSPPVNGGEPQGILHGLGHGAGCSPPVNGGGPQVVEHGQLHQQGCAPPANGGNRGPSRGRRNRLRRWRNAIARRNHALHEYTSWLAAHGGDIEVVRPPLAEAVRTGAGDAREHGALVAFKARANRALLDAGIGKLCELLAYKLEARGRRLTVTEDADHAAMVPELAASTAKLAKKVSRMGGRGANGTEKTQ